jgi:hypothetical protein
MHTVLDGASKDVLRAFTHACAIIAENIHGKATPDNFAALVRFEVERLAEKQDFIDFTPEMREAFFQIALDALAEAFEIDKAAIALEYPQNDFKEQEPPRAP